MIKKTIVIAITILMVGCASFEPKPGMTFEQFKSMTALSFNGGVMSLGKLSGTNIDVYETSDQDFRRVKMKRTAPAEGWTYFYFNNGKLMDQKDVQSIVDQRAAQQRKIEQDRAEQQRKLEQERAAALAKQQSDAQARAAKAQKEEAVRKQQQQNQQKLNQL